MEHNEHHAEDTSLRKHFNSVRMMQKKEKWRAVAEMKQERLREVSKVSGCPQSASNEDGLAKETKGAK